MSVRAWMPNFFWSQFMVASSVTGTGQGESFGKYKPQNSSGCGCGCGNGSNIFVQSSMVKRNCIVRHNFGNINKINIGSSINSSKIC